MELSKTGESAQEGERKQVVKKERLQVQNALGRVICGILTSHAAF